MGGADSETREITQSQVLKEGFECELDSKGSGDGQTISVKDIIIFIS